MEDSTALAKMLRVLLEKHGFVVEDAANGRIGLQKMEVFRPAMALVDLMMPEVDGFEVLRKMRINFPEIKAVAFSAQPPQVVEKQVIALGAEIFLQKPLREQVLLGLARKYTDEVEDLEEDIQEKILPHEKDQTFVVHIKACYICGYDHVNVFVPRTDTFEISWNTGLFPTYKSKPGFTPWDHLRTQVSVCPSCLFASTDPDDFAQNSKRLNFPYKIDAKKILARNISVRRRLIDANAELELKFSNPNRDIHMLLQTFQLAEKCGNGLVLGDKEGVYCEIGRASLMQAVLRWTLDGNKNAYQNHLREALSTFHNQLKVANTRRHTRAQSYYFIIALHMALGESIRANEMKEELEKFYRVHGVEEASDEERLWNQRLAHIWRVGVEAELFREIQSG